MVKRPSGSKQGQPDSRDPPAMTLGFKRSLIGIVGSLLAVLMAINVLPAAKDGARYIPVGNDSFYHARRILDAVANPSGYYEFDSRIHAPEGSLLTWPWAYDYVMSVLVRAGLGVGVSTDPMAILDFLPVMGLPIAVLLLLFATSTLRLSLWSQAAAVLCFALCPLTQVLFGVGCIDHHYVEYLFALAALAAGLWWMDEPGDIRRAIALGVLLGIAPAFQNGLFILQLPLLGAVGWRWLRGESLPNRSARAFAAALVLATLLALIPSQPFRELDFSYYLFSWFHLYIACATGLLVWLLAAISPTRRGYIIVAAVAIALLLPILGQVHVSGRYFSSNVEREYRIGEVSSPLEMIRAQGLAKILRSYSGLLLLAPIIIVGCCWYLVRRNTDRVVAYLCVGTVFGLVMLLDKYRFNNFGSFALVLAPLVAVETLARRQPRHRLAIALATAGVLLAAFYLPITRGLFSKQIPSGDYNYPLSSEIFPAIREACAREPGIVLADNTDGHFIRFHSDCSVIADNFMLTEQHIRKLREMESLMRMSPQELLQAPNVPRYVYAHYISTVVIDGRGRTTLANAAQAASADRPLVRALLTGRPEDLDKHFRLLKELRFEGEDGYPYARFFEIVK